jgi:hypothetical protein
VRTADRDRTGMALTKREKVVYLLGKIDGIADAMSFLDGVAREQKLPQTLRNPIHDAQPLPAPAPAPQPHGDRVIYEARN